MQQGDSMYWFISENFLGSAAASSIGEKCQINEMAPHYDQVVALLVASIKKQL